MRDQAAAVDIAAEYPMLLDLLTSATRTIMLLPLQAMSNFVGHAETIGPILEPTAYARGGGRNLADQAALIEAAIGLQRAAEKITGLTSGGGQ